MQLERVVTMDLRQGMREIEHRFGDNALIVSNQKVAGKIELIVAIDIEPILDPNEEYALVLGRDVRELDPDAGIGDTRVRSQLVTPQERSESGRQLASGAPGILSSRARPLSVTPPVDEAVKYPDSERPEGDIVSRPAFEDLLKRVTRLDVFEQPLSGRKANGSAARFAVSV